MLKHDKTPTPAAVRDETRFHLNEPGGIAGLFD